MGMKLLIDADIYAYRALSATEDETEWSDGVWSLTTDHPAALKLFQNELMKFLDMFDTQDYILCFSDKENFRKHLNPTYKSGRKKSRKPLGYVTFVERLQQDMPHMVKPTLEADDVLGILATMPSNVGKCIVISDDKDLKTIPCKLYRPGAEERLDVTEAEADRWFLTQTLTGDATDGYSGCPSIGPKKAEAVLGKHPSWSSVVAAFKKQGLTEDDALLQARMARILRHSDWDLKQQQPILWEPST